MEKRLYELVIDKELEMVTPPLTTQEFKALREDLLEHGCLSPIVVWKGKIVDGHHRYAICKTECIPFAIEHMHFDSRSEAKLWIARNQLGRRNLNDFQRCEMVLPLEPDIKADVAQRRKQALSAAMRRTEKGRSTVRSNDTRDLLAKMAGVSHTTFEKVKFILADGDSDIISKLRRGDMKIHSAFVLIKNRNRGGREPYQGYTEDRAYEPRSRRNSDDRNSGNRQRYSRQSFHSVQEQIRVSIENLVREVESARDSLRREDQSRIPVLINMLDEGFELVESMLSSEL